MNRLMRMPTARPVPVRATGAEGPQANQSAVIALDAPPPGAALVRCEQAIFTSIRSPMGEGYRLVAHSPGISHDERAEITRRSPSHESLSGAAANAYALLAFPLSSGRLAIAHCTSAGEEYTGRGGLRVWSHYVVLDDDAFAAYGCNPVRVQRALAANALTTQNPPQTLDLIALPAWNHTDISQHVCGAADAEACVRLIDACLRGGRWAIAGVRQPARSCEWTYDLMPPIVRRRMSISYGLGFCLARELDVTFVDAVRANLERLTRGQNVNLRDVSAGAELSLAYTPWFNLIRAWAPQQRWSRISRLAARISGPLEPDALNRVADLSLDLDAAAVADDDAKARLREKYADFAALTPVEVELFAELSAAIAPPPEPEESADPDSENHGGVIIRDGK